MDPEPYWIANSEPLALYEDEADASYFECRKQAIEVHFELGTHKLLDPVSRMTLNCMHDTGQIRTCLVLDCTDTLGRCSNSNIGEVLRIHEVCGGELLITR